MSIGYCQDDWEWPSTKEWSSQHGTFVMPKKYQRYNKLVCKQGYYPACRKPDSNEWEDGGKQNRTKCFCSKYYGCWGVIGATTIIITHITRAPHALLHRYLTIPERTIPHAARGILNIWSRGKRIRK